MADWSVLTAGYKDGSSEKGYMTGIVRADATTVTVRTTMARSPTMDLPRSLFDATAKPAEKALLKAFLAKKKKRKAPWYKKPVYLIGGGVAVAGALYLILRKRRRR